MSGFRVFDDGDDHVRDRRSVGVAEHVVATDGETLVAYGLGACVGIVLHDADAGVGALAHVVLPRQSEGSTAPASKFADGAVRRMLQEMVEAGATYASVDGWIVGGADIFELDALPSRIGQRTAAVAHDELVSLDVTVVDERVGGDTGRTVEFDTETGEVFVLTARGKEPTRLDRGRAAED